MFKYFKLFCIVFLFCGIKPVQAQKDFQTLNTELFKDIKIYREKFVAKDFQFLETKLKKLHQESGESKHNTLRYNAFVKAIATGDPKNLQIYDEWITKYPDSPAAYWLKCEDLHTQAQSYRGYKYSIETHKSRFEAMQFKTYQSTENCQKALEIDATFSPMYRMLIGNANLQGKETYRRYLLKENIEKAINPRIAMGTYMIGTQRRWGGTPKDVEIATDIFEPFLKNRPDLHVYRDYELMHYARAAQLDDNKDQALSFLKQLIDKHGKENNLATLQSAHIYKVRKQYDKAYALYKDALKADPLCHDCYHQLASIENKRKNAEKAIQYLSLAIFLDPMNMKYLGFRGNLYSRNPQTYNKAKKDLDKAIILGKYHIFSRRSRGNFYMNKLKDYAEAEKDYEMVFNLEPDDISNAYDYGLALFYQKDCKAVRPLEALKQLCTVERCDPKSVQWLNQSLPMLNQICPKAMRQ